MSSKTTITDHKAAFIRSQVRHLSKSLAESPAWRSPAIVLSPPGQGQDERDAGLAIPDKSVEDIVNKVNAKIKTHNRTVFAAASQRHVAEQIDTLYWNEVAKETSGVERNATWIKKNTDLCETAIIHSLPEHYKDLHIHNGHVSSGDDDATYTDGRTRLTSLAQKRDELKQKAELYRMLRDLLIPFENAKENVQPNLVTKDGELNRELEKMKTLIARVTGRLGQLQSLQAPQLDAPASTNNDKLRQVLQLG